jgi:hypothetical protein
MNVLIKVFLHIFFFDNNILLQCGNRNFTALFPFFGNWLLLPLFYLFLRLKQEVGGRSCCICPLSCTSSPALINVVVVHYNIKVIGHLRNTSFMRHNRLSLPEIRWWFFLDLFDFDSIHFDQLHLADGFLKWHFFHLRFMYCPLLLLFTLGGALIG